MIGALVQQSAGAAIGVFVGVLIGLSDRVSGGRRGADRDDGGHLFHARERVMILTTTSTVEGHTITDYRGIVVGEAIMGANVVRDFFAGITDIVGGRSGAYETKLQDARETAMAELEERARAKGANAVVGIDLDYEVVGDSMLMVSVSGTAVVLG